MKIRRLRVSSEGGLSLRGTYSLPSTECLLQRCRIYRITALRDRMERDHLSIIGKSNKSLMAAFSRDVRLFPYLVLSGLYFSHKT